MFVINFQKQFAPDVESGMKRQTIRANRKDGKRPQPGEHLRCYTGMRTKSCRRLLDATCLTVLPVQIFEELPLIAVVVGGRKLSMDEGIAFAKADGFESRAEFLGFFHETHGFPFDGWMATWEPKP